MNSWHEAVLSLPGACASYVTAGLVVRAGLCRLRQQPALRSLAATAAAERAEEYLPLKWIWDTLAGNSRATPRRRDLAGHQGLNACAGYDCLKTPL